MKLAYIAGPGTLKDYLEAGEYLDTMGYIAMNQFRGSSDEEDNRAERLAAVRGCDLLFLLDGWKKQPKAVDEWEAALFYNREKDAGIEISYPEYRG